MIPWWWTIVALFIGVFVGIFLIALMEASRQVDDDKRWWNDP